MDSWDTFAVIVGGAAAALLGLLFVAISIRLDVVAGSAELRNRAAQTLTHFAAMLLLAILLGVPGQSKTAFGSELMALAVSTAVALHVLERRAAGRSGRRRGIEPVLDTVSPNMVTCALLLASGVLLVVGLGAGLYLLVAPVIASFASGIVNAWLFMIRLQG